jgi:hypothetical protein
MGRKGDLEFYIWIPYVIEAYFKDLQTYFGKTTANKNVRSVGNTAKV